MPACERCGKPTRETMCSFFNMEQCCDECLGIEGAHPTYTVARAVEEAMVRNGETNFPGVGLPAELREDAELRKVTRQ